MWDGLSEAEERKHDRPQPRLPELRYVGWLEVEVTVSIARG